MKRNLIQMRLCVLLLATISSLVACSGSEKNNIVADEIPVKKGGVLISADSITGRAAELYQEKFTNNNYSAYFSKKDLIRLIVRSGIECKGFRVYRTMNNNNKIDDIAVIGMVIVGVDSDRKDITVGRDKKLSAQAFISYDICPNNCDRESFFCIKEKE